jgi:hypothetical protein
MDLRQLLCLAVQLNVTIEPSWVEGANNELADALSCFDITAIANWCPHWQAP